MFTEEQQQHIDQLIADKKATWEAEQLAPVIAERDELLQYAPKQKTNEQKEIEQLKAQLQHQKLVSSLEKANLSDFVDFLDVQDDGEVQAKIEKLNAVLEARKLSNNYVPDNHKQTSKYEQAAQKGDTVGMLQAKLNKLFG
ncbi:hypothetical protein [Paenibacillus vini]|uniref:DUF4355 domain-containing protein n=1 Tax=Paenibacillus vini TaxID=1476024 RepID=A0ABQ4M8A9_9BACL|nr:hypothetical protein [Paenibacillus vini]GIP52202.1 hypothetical protein J42TS3_12370 [Paenibacillus vini]